MKKRISVNLILLGLIIVSVISAFVIFAPYSSAVAETEVEATYYFEPISDTECEVKCSNRGLATVACVPSTAEIDGKIYQVTQVASNGFISAKNLKSISLPSTVKVIDNTAFATCKSLTSISLPNVETINLLAFYGCQSLTSISLPNVETINRLAFYGCQSLTSISLPNVETINRRAFMNCTSLKYVYFPEIKHLDDYIFQGCTSLTEIYIPPTIETVGPFVFSNDNSEEYIEYMSLELKCALNNENSENEVMFFENVSTNVFDFPISEFNVRLEISAIKVYDFILEDIPLMPALDFSPDRISVHIPLKHGYLSLKLSIS